MLLSLASQPSTVIVQNTPPQGYPPQGYPPQGYPPQGYPPQGPQPFPTGGTAPPY